MNVIETVKKILSEYDEIQEFSSVVHVDFTTNTSDTIGLSSTNDILVSSDVLGNENRQHTFMMYAVTQASNDFDRLNNSNFLLKLGYYLGTIKNYVIDNGYIKSMSCSSQMMLSTLDGDVNNRFMYQIQIIVDYQINI